MSEDEHVYLTEQAAFEGTPLDDMHDRSSIILECREIITECPVLVGPVTVLEGRVNMTRYGGIARPGRRTITFAPRMMGRYLAVHEVSHIVHARSGLGGRSHGPEWRGIYVDMVEIVYDVRYAHLLRHAFLEAGIPANGPFLPKTGQPIINIDALTDVTRTVRWL